MYDPAPAPRENKGAGLAGPQSREGQGGASDRNQTQEVVGELAGLKAPGSALSEGPCPLARATPVSKGDSDEPLSWPLGPITSPQGMEPWDWPGVGHRPVPRAWEE